MFFMLNVAGSSQISKWTAFVLTIEENDVVLWDPEIGEHYKLSDSRCSLMKVSRLINHSGVSIKQLFKYYLVIRFLNNTSLHS